MVPRGRRRAAAIRHRRSVARRTGSRIRTANSAEVCLKAWPSHCWCNTSAGREVTSILLHDCSLWREATPVSVVSLIG